MRKTLLRSALVCLALVLSVEAYATTRTTTNRGLTITKYSGGTAVVRVSSANNIQTYVYLHLTSAEVTSIRTVVNATDGGTNVTDDANVPLMPSSPNFTP